MGITIYYLEPVATGTALTYSVQRCEDGMFFDFDLELFRVLEDIPDNAASQKMFHCNDRFVGEFEHAGCGVEYIIRVHNMRRKGRIIAEIPLVSPGTPDHGETSNGAPDMDPSYRAGKKYFDGKVIEARHRLTFYGNDGFTIHTATLWEDGTSSCNCPTWGPKVDGRRRCKHSDRALTLIESIDETGERPVPPPAVPRVTSRSQRIRPVDT